MLKVGDIVKIKSIDQLEKYDSYKSGLNISMKNFAEFIATITEIAENNVYKLNIDDGWWRWNSEMFETGNLPYCFIDKIPYKFTSSIFGNCTIIHVSDDPDYPYDIELQDGDVISVTKDFKFFKDSKKSIL